MRDARPMPHGSRRGTAITETDEPAVFEGLSAPNAKCVMRDELREIQAARASKRAQPAQLSYGRPGRVSGDGPCLRWI